MATTRRGGMPQPNRAQDCRHQNSGAGRRRPGEIESRRLGRRLAHDRRRPHDRAMQPRHFEAHSEPLKLRFDLRQSPYEHADAQKHPRDPRAGDLRFIVSRPLAAIVRILPSRFRFPISQQHDDAHHRHDARRDIHQPRSVQIGHEKLHDREAAAGDRDRRPHPDDAAPSGHRPHEPCRHDEREEWQLSPGHRTQPQFADSRHRLQCRDGSAEHPNATGAVFASKQSTAASRGAKASADHDGRRHGHRCAEPGRPFEKRAETKRNQDRLNPPIVRMHEH